MSDRWNEELQKLRSVHPSGDLWNRVDAGAVPRTPPSELRPRQRIVAAVTAFAVFALAVFVAWRTLRPDPTDLPPVTGRGVEVPPLVISVLDRDTAPPIHKTTESYAAGHSPHVLDLTFGFNVGRWKPTMLSHRPHPPLSRLSNPYLYADTDPVLNAGAPVEVSSHAGSVDVSMIPIRVRYPLERAGATVPLTDGATLPAPGYYVFSVRAVTGKVVEEWRTPVYVLAPGTLQLLWFNDGTAPNGGPLIAAAVNGAYLKCGTFDASVMQQGSPSPIPDDVPPLDRALTVTSGAHIAFLEPGYTPSAKGNQTDASLSYADPVAPYEPIDRIDFVDPGQVVAVLPGQYMFRWHVDVPSLGGNGGFQGDLLCPMDVVPNPDLP